MNRTVFIIGLAAAAISSSWLLSDPSPTAPVNLHSLRAVLIQYSGLIGLGAMSASMMLAAQPDFFARSRDRLDKVYRLHLGLGIVSLIFAGSHWLWINSLSQTVARRWAPLLNVANAAEKPFLDPIQQFTTVQPGLVEFLGEWSFYAAVVALALIVVSRIPQRRFVMIHKCLAAAYLLMASHVLVSMKAGYWPGPVGVFMLFLVACGSISAVVIILRRRVSERTDQAPTSA